MCSFRPLPRAELGKGKGEKGGQGKAAAGKGVDGGSGSNTGGTRETLAEKSS